MSWWRHQMEHFPRYWPFVRRIHRSPVDSPHKCPWRGVLIFSLICAWTNGWADNRYADLRRRHAHYDVTVMIGPLPTKPTSPLHNFNAIYQQGPLLSPAYLSYGPGWNISGNPSVHIKQGARTCVFPEPFPDGGVKILWVENKTYSWRKPWSSQCIVYASHGITQG